MSWIEQEIEQLNWTHPQVRRCPEQHPEDNAADLLAIQAMALAGGIYGSDEIAEICRCDPAFDDLCRGHPPFPHELRSFRGQNRPVLERILTGVLTRAVSARSGLAVASFAVELRHEIQVSAVERLDQGRHADQG